jgi:hypothetical protein
MGQLAVPMMIGAAVGGGTKLLQGKGLGSILKGAALGGALGGATGGIGGLMSQGATGAVGAAGEAGLGGAGITGLEGGLLNPLGQGIQLAPSTAGTLDFIPQAMQVSNAPMSLAGGGIALPESVATQLATGNVGSMGNNLSSLASKYGTIDNLQGAAQVASMYQPTPMQAAPSGRIEVGQAPTGAIYDELRKLGYTMPQRRETNFSLLG